MKNEKPKIALPIAVEGKYDKAALLSIFDATVITTSGFGIFNSKEKQALVRRVAERGIILLTDSDGGGSQIRSFLSSIIPKDKIYHAYIPKIAGKERRKRQPSRAGLLGVEGVGREALLSALAPFIGCDGPKRTMSLDAARLFSDGLSGTGGASASRDRVAAAFGLPWGMSAKAFAAAMSLIATEEEYQAALLTI